MNRLETMKTKTAQLDEPTNGSTVAVAPPPARIRAKADKEDKPVGVDIPQLAIDFLRFKVVGDSQLVCHAWDPKAVQMMLDKQTMKAKQGKEAKDPEACYLGSLYKMDDGRYGFPARAFKAAAVDACSHVQGITKVLARGAFHVVGDLVLIDGAPRMRQDMVRVGMGTADIRFRGEFPEWSCELLVRYNKNVISTNQIINLFNVAGFAIGVGEFRPEKNGSWGMFHVS